PAADRSRRHAPREAGGGPLSVAALGRGTARDPRRWRAGIVVPEPPRLRALDLVPRLRPPVSMPELHRLAGRAPLHPPADLPPLRLRRAGSGDLPGMPRRGDAGTVRPGGRTPRRGGRGAFSRGTHRAD